MGGIPPVVKLEGEGTPLGEKPAEARGSDAPVVSRSGEWGELAPEPFLLLKFPSLLSGKLLEPGAIPELPLSVVQPPLSPAPFLQLPFSLEAGGQRNGPFPK